MGNILVIPFGVTGFDSQESIVRDIKKIFVRNNITYDTIKFSKTETVIEYSGFIDFNNLAIPLIKVFQGENFQALEEQNFTKLDEYRHSILLDLMLPPKISADMQANLAEVFPLWVERHGLAAAYRIRKMQIARLIVGEYWNKALELIKAFKLIGS